MTSPAPKAAIEDFGEKITGARKDLAKEFAARHLGDLSDDELSSMQFAKIFPKPDWQKLVDGGADPLAVASVRAMRESIPRRPGASRSYRLKGWVKQVRMLREFSLRVLDGSIPANFLETAPNADELASVRFSAGLYAGLGHSADLSGLTLHRNEWSQQWSVSTTEKNLRAYNLVTGFRDLLDRHQLREGSVPDLVDLAIAHMKDALCPSDAPSVQATTSSRKSPRFGVFSRRSGGAYMVGCKLPRGGFLELRSFGTVAEAYDFLKAPGNAALLEEEFQALRAPRSERNPGNRFRKGPAVREPGASVTPEQFMSTFNLRGVQFGNYVEQSARQASLDQAYDALVDLSSVTGAVSPASLSLEGELALAFGARGTGGINAASAHYEPSQIVMNLTKRAGPGSLAHEWFHGLDNAIARRAGKRLSFATDSGYGVSDPLSKAFSQAVTEIIKSTNVGERSVKADRFKSKPYWSSKLEIAARAFESFVIDALEQRGVVNDYLSNVASAAVWGDPESYPYPTPEEMPVIRAVFTGLLNKVSEHMPEQWKGVTPPPAPGPQVRSSTVRP